MQGQDKLTLKPDAPERYVVVPGDTLWSIAQRYLDAPYRWTDLWSQNRDGIKNPNRIYPGDVLVLDKAKGQLARADTVKMSPRIRAEQTRDKEIPSIPPNLIEPYLSKPLVVEADGLDNAPTVVGTEGNRVVLGAGNIAFVSGLGNSKEDTWHIYRRGRALIDPETQQSLGYEAVQLGTARVKSGGDPATVDIVAATQEISKGDKLVAAGRPQPVTYAPRAPGKQIRGQIMSVYGGAGMASEAARHSVVVLNRGASQGLEPGHVLAIYRAGVSINAPRGTLSSLPVTESLSGPRTPDERIGLLFVFRVFDRVSYGLVMNVSRPVNTRDVVQTRKLRPSDAPSRPPGCGDSPVRLCPA
ncbi:MAG: LysM peptidoglycan-binding domain-containing protein [Betaproteobacteria bacterium]|nr:LysM peptidoglycan-binding domain-containing protein [Betaproteobacteria bacterium]